MVCSKCKKDKNEEEFNWRIVGVKRHGYCKTCNSDNLKSHYSRNKQYYIDKATRNKTKSRDFIWEYLSTHPCVDCGETNPIVLEFDHVVGSKDYEVSKFLSRTIPSLQREIGKCEVRCANCHRIRTAEERGWWKDKVGGSNPSS